MARRRFFVDRVHKGEAESGGADAQICFPRNGEGNIAGPSEGNWQSALYTEGVAFILTEQDVEVEILLSITPLGRKSGV